MWTTDVESAIEKYLRNTFDILFPHMSYESIISKFSDIFVMLMFPERILHCQIF